MIALAIDISNYTGEVSYETAKSLADNGLKRVIIQYVNEQPNNVSLCQRQVDAFKRAGVEVQAYVYVWFSAGEQWAANRVARACVAMRALGVDMMWLDCEQSDHDTPSFDYVHAPVSPTIRACIDAVTKTGMGVGIYTAKWWWEPGASNSTEWSSLPLWDANYDSAPALVPAGYGGWGVPAMKQYIGNTSFMGVNNIDMNSFETSDAVNDAPFDYGLTRIRLEDMLRLIRDEHEHAHGDKQVLHDIIDGKR